MNYTELSTFNGFHKGRQGFVCGSGTSLKEIPHDLDRHGILICVNAAALHFRRCDYLFVTDTAVINTVYWEEVASKSDIIIFANPHFEKVCEQVSVKFTKPVFLMTRKYDNHDDYRFIDDKLCIGHDAPMAATHLAYVMGLRPIYLCGIDLCFDGSGKRYFDDVAFRHADNSPFKAAFEKDYEDSKMDVGYKTDKYLLGSIPMWKKIYEQNPGIGEVILNTSRISKIQEFQKVSIHEVLNKNPK